MKFIQIPDVQQLQTIIPAPNISLNKPAQTCDFPFFGNRSKSRRTQKMMGCYVWRFALMHTLFSPSVKQNLDLRTREPINLMMIPLSQFPNMARNWDICHCQTNISGMVISLGTSSQYSYSSLINVTPINLHQISSISQWNHPQIPSNHHQAITIYIHLPKNIFHSTKAIYPEVPEGYPLVNIQKKLLKIAIVK